MALFEILLPLLLIALAIFLFQQIIIPVAVFKPIFPIFKEKIKREKMTAEKALDLVEYHCSQALHFIGVAESYAENEKESAKDKLEKARDIEKSVKKRSSDLKTFRKDDI